jgi:hypothetical protein
LETPALEGASAQTQGKNVKEEKKEEPEKAKEGIPSHG